MKSPVTQEQQQQVVDPLLRIKKRVSCLQKKIKRIEDPEGYVQEVVAEKRDKFLNNALARFERRQAQRSERREDQKQEVVPEKKTQQKRQKVEKSVIVVEDYGGKKTEQSEFDADAPLKQMVVEEDQQQQQQQAVVRETRAAPSLLSYNSKAITKAPPTSLVRKPGTGPQPPVPSLLSGSRLLRQ